MIDVEWDVQNDNGTFKLIGGFEGTNVPYQEYCVAEFSEDRVTTIHTYFRTEKGLIQIGSLNAGSSITIDEAEELVLQQKVLVETLAKDLWELSTSGYWDSILNLFPIS